MNQLLKFDSQELDGLELCRNVYSLFEEIRTTREGVSSMRLRLTAFHKKLIEELKPICIYVQRKYQAGRQLNISWYAGNQQYDAIMRGYGFLVEQGLYKEEQYLEVASAMHPNDYLAREKLEKDGFRYGYDTLKRNKDRSIESIPVATSGNEHVEPMIESTSEIIQKKLAINYPSNTSLIVQVFSNNIYHPWELQYFVENIRERFNDFSFEEIFLCSSSQDYYESIYPRNEP